jgi:hypothetical protein
VVVVEDEESNDGCCYYGCLGTSILTFSVIICICVFPLAIFAGLRVIREYERAVIFRLGRIKNTNKGIKKASARVTF